MEQEKQESFLKDVLAKMKITYPPIEYFGKTQKHKK